LNTNLHPVFAKENLMDEQEKENALDNDDELEETEHDDEFELPPERRKPKILPVIGTIVLILLIIGGFFAVRSIGGSVTGTAPKPTATLFPGANLFYITINPNMGAVSIDGHALSKLPTVGDTPIQLSEGTHEIVWNEPPFKSQHCFATVPPQQNAGTDACSTTAVATVSKGKDSGLQAAVIEFEATSNMLSSSQKNALITTAQATTALLDSSTTVQPGEQYVDVQAPHGIATATQPLKATQHFQLDTNPNTSAPCLAGVLGTGQSCTVDGINCVNICSLPSSLNAPSGNFNPPPSPTTWDIYMVLHATWTYTMMSGQTVATDQPDILDNTAPEYLFALFATWTGSQWHVSLTPGHDDFYAFLTTSPVCVPAQSYISEQYRLSNPTINGQIQEISWQDYFASSSNPATGCLVGATELPANANTPVTANTPEGYYLYRFGILSAVDSLGHTLSPSLPVASAYDQSIAQQLMPKKHK
jgi:hypothetical protein